MNNTGHTGEAPSFPPSLLPSFPPSLLPSFPPSLLPSFPQRGRQGNGIMAVGVQAEK